jgi:hypothetical protein
VLRECGDGSGAVTIPDYDPSTGVYTGSESLTIDDSYKGHFIAVDFGESMIPAYFKIHCLQDNRVTDVSQSVVDSCPGKFRLYGSTDKMTTIVSSQGWSQ